MNIVQKLLFKKAAQILLQELLFIIGTITNDTNHKINKPKFSLTNLSVRRLIEDILTFLVGTSSSLELI